MRRESATAAERHQDHGRGVADHAARDTRELDHTVVLREVVFGSRIEATAAMDRRVQSVGEDACRARAACRSVPTPVHPDDLRGVAVMAADRLERRNQVAEREWREEPEESNESP